jgi:hypothetical protein
MFCVFRDAAMLWFRLHHAILLFSLRLSIKSLKKIMVYAWVWHRLVPSLNDPIKHGGMENADIF